MFTISLCMIIKDEESVLDRVLSCAKKFADEIIIVDTGSKDNSVNIAKKYTNNIFYFKWTDNFSDARNFSFSKATKDYIMWLDADDLITDAEIEKILNLKRSNKDIPMYLFKYSVAFENNIPTFYFYRERLLKRELNFKWQGFIHEVIPLVHDAKYVDINIEHRKIKEGNRKRNLNIYRNAKNKGILFTPRDTYYYARELYYNAYYKSSLRELKKFLNCESIYPPNFIEATILINNIYLHLNDISHAKKYLLNALKNNTPTAQLACAIGNVFLLEKKYEQAKFWYETAMQIKEIKIGFCEADYNEFIPHLQLSIIYYNLNNIPLSKYHHEKAKKLKPNHPAILNNDKFFS